jgi:hypothetical protein
MAVMVRRSAGDIEVDVEAGLDRAQVDRRAVLARVGIDDQPPGAVDGGLLGVEELDDAAPPGHRLQVEVAAHVPHQQGGVEVLQRQLGGHPALAPAAHGLDHGLHLAAGRGQVIFEHPAVAAGDAAHHAGVLQVAQALDQQGRRHPRHAAPQIVEPGRAGDHLAQQHHGPPRAQHLGRHRHRAELPIAALRHRHLRMT